MSSPFQKAFSAKSPLHNHGNKDIERAKKLSKKDGEDGDFNYESDKVMKLKTRGETKNASHSNSKDQVNLPSTADEQQSTINMNSPAKAVDELKGNMVKKLIKIDPNKPSDPNNRPPREIPSKKESREVKPPVHKNYPPKKKLKA